MAAGYIYALINPSLEGLVKIGKTTRDPTDRVRELSSSTAAPTPFVLAFDVYVDPRSWADDAVARRGADVLAPLLNREPAELIAATRAQERGDYLAARALNASVGLELLKLGPPGVKLVDRSERFYPEGDLASGLLGFIGRDQVGLAGIEADFDQELGGTPGVVYLERDGLGNPLPFGRRLLDTPAPGGRGRSVNSTRNRRGSERSRKFQWIFP